MRERKVIKHTSRFVSHHHRPLPRLTLLDCLEIIYLLKVEEVREVRRGLRNLRVESHGLFRRRFAGEDGESTHRLEGCTTWRRFASAECLVTEYTSRFKLRIMNSANSDLSAKGTRSPFASHCHRLRSRGSQLLLSQNCLSTTDPGTGPSVDVLSMRKLDVRSGNVGPTTGPATPSATRVSACQTTAVAHGSEEPPETFFRD